MVLQNDRIWVGNNRRAMNLLATPKGGTALTGLGSGSVTESDPIPGSAGRQILARHGRLGMVAGGAGSMAWRRAALVMRMVSTAI
jgi:hypothetical protein